MHAKVNFDSLVEASLRLKVGYKEAGDVIELLENGEEYIGGMGYDMVGDATNLLLGISNVQILYLSASTVEVLYIDLNLLIAYE